MKKPSLFVTVNSCSVRFNFQCCVLRIIISIPLAWDVDGILIAMLFMQVAMLFMQVAMLFMQVVIFLSEKNYS